MANDDDSAMRNGIEKAQHYMRKITGLKPVGHGPFHEGQNGYVDQKPYLSVFPNGTFQGYDGSLWVYFKFPEDVKVQWNTDPLAAIYNQHFFIDLVNALGRKINNQTESKTRHDIRREFHIQITKDDFKGIRGYPHITPAHRDYLDRMANGENNDGGGYSKPEWHGYLGIRVQEGSTFHEAYGLKSKFQRWRDMIADDEVLQYHLFNKDLRDVIALANAHKFRSMNFMEDENGYEDYERLTAWHGISDDAFGLSKQLETTPMLEPLHGLSIITPRWGEISFHAVTPLPDVHLVDPLSTASRWSDPLYRPTNNVTAMNIRGQIRSPQVAENVFDAMRLGNISEGSDAKKSGFGNSISDKERRQKNLQRVERSRRVSAAGHALVDNVEIIVATEVRKGQENGLNESLRSHFLRSVPLLDRQPEAMNSTFPTYPKPVFPTKTGNKTRGENTNQVYAGVLAMSGIFRKTKPCASGGILLGLSEGGFEFAEIYTELEAAKQENDVPGMLITGRPGAGKALGLDTNIMTPNGPVRMGDVKLGDTVFGRDGKPCKVTFVTDIQHERELYRVQFSDGQSVIADKDHQWLVSTSSDRHYSKYRGRSEWVVQSQKESDHQSRILLEESEKFGSDSELGAAEIADLVIGLFPPGKSPFNSAPTVSRSLQFTDCPYRVVDGRGKRMYPVAIALKSLSMRVQQKKLLGGDDLTRVVTTGDMVNKGVSSRYTSGKVSNEFFIPVPSAVEYPEAGLPLDPYVLGLWLGDGERGGNRIGSGDVGLSVDPKTGISDQEIALAEIGKAGYQVRKKNGSGDYVIVVDDLTPDLRNAGVLFDKHIPDVYLRSSKEQRLALLQGLMDSDGNSHDDGRVGFANTNLRLMDQTKELVRSLGIRVNWKSPDSSEGMEYPYTHDLSEECKEKVASRGAYQSQKMGYGISFWSEMPVFRIPRKLANQSLSAHPRAQWNPIVSIESVETEPVRCISVDSEDSTYLVEGGIVTHNTQQMLQMAAQICYQGHSLFYLNPKKDSTLQPFFDLLGGLTINMGAEYLNENPGLMDPVGFLKNREDVATTITESIQSAMRMYQDTGSEASSVRANLGSEIQDRSLDLRNRSSGDIIFGNPSAGTQPISDVNVINFVKNKMRYSPFWKSFISEDPVDTDSSTLRTQLTDGRPVLIEWDSSMQLPDVESPESSYSDPQVDSILSVTVAFKYAAEIVGSEQRGGAIISDEAWVFKASKEAMKIITKGAREWRQGNIMLVMGTQRLLDFLEPGSTNLATYFARYLVMAIGASDEDEMKMFFKLASIHPSDQDKLRKYMTTAGAKSESSVSSGADKKKGNKTPKAYYIDRIYGWEGGLICGPWPKRELNMGRTDSEGEGMRKKNANSGVPEALRSEFGNDLASIVVEDLESSRISAESE